MGVNTRGSFLFAHRLDRHDIEAFSSMAAERRRVNSKVCGPKVVTSTQSGMGIVLGGRLAVVIASTGGRWVRGIIFILVIARYVHDTLTSLF